MKTRPPSGAAAAWGWSTNPSSSCPPFPCSTTSCSQWISAARPVLAAEIHWEHDVVEQGKGGHELEGLVDHPQAAAAPLGGLVFIKLMDRHAADPDLAGGQMIDSGNHIN